MDLLLLSRDPSATHMKESKYEEFPQSCVLPAFENWYFVKTNKQRCLRTIRLNKLEE